jgi:lipoate-protein ligase A
MHTSQAVRKVRGGKLVQLSLSHHDGVITGALLTGDFFVHPEEGLVQIEEALRGAALTESIETLIEEVVRKNRLILVGFSPRDIAELVEVAGACGD